MKDEEEVKFFIPFLFYLSCFIMEKRFAKKLIKEERKKKKKKKKTRKKSLSSIFQFFTNRFLLISIHDST